ncbi:MAG: hypothetical protein FJ215_07245 [Ignavibacteria bacterium]|nr:hypothetical protein [Ignavibacteria bacterium]
MEWTEGEWIVKKRRHLPHWQMRGATYFVTFRIGRGAMTPDEQVLVLDHIRGGSEKYYKLHAAIVMPDHAHILITPKKNTHSREL